MPVTGTDRFPAAAALAFPRPFPRPDGHEISSTAAWECSIVIAVTGDEPAAIRGRVRTYDAERGWGVIDAPEVPGGCWAHFSVIAIDGFRALVPGKQVTFSWEPVSNQDGYRFRALTVWP